jgi:hypothetical protein
MNLQNCKSPVQFTTRRTTNIRLKFKTNNSAVLDDVLGKRKFQDEASATVILGNVRIVHGCATVTRWVRADSKLIHLTQTNELPHSQIQCWGKQKEVEGLYYPVNQQTLCNQYLPIGVGCTHSSRQTECM